MVEYDIVNVPIVDIVNQIILYAAKNRASDIHMDPHEDALLIRMRIDGELRNHTVIPKAYERNLITRVKLISNMNITETRLPQDGSIKGRIEDRDLDMRVSVLPTNEGEKVVIRILDFSKSLSGIASLGFSEKNFDLLQKMIAVPNGIILVTGATGSGKSTTTYSMLQELNKENTNIITVEDPVEMNIEGINQVQVNSEIGLTFAAVLRSILRQDPNVILIGEIRDSETAQIAVRASITGHLVFSTIHTNNSLNTIERLLDMDVERYLLSSALTGVISQKLARKLCPKCKKLRATTEYEKEIFRLVLNKEVSQVHDAVGCPECTDGYRGRIPLQEVLYINDSLRSVIANPKTTKEELKDLVYTDDVTTLLGDGLEKVIAGETTFSELFKLIEIDLEIKSLKEDKERREKKLIIERAMASEPVQQPVQQKPEQIVQQPVQPVQPQPVQAAPQPVQQQSVQPQQPVQPKPVQAAPQPVQQQSVQPQQPIQPKPVQPVQPQPVQAPVVNVAPTTKKEEIEMLEDDVINPADVNIKLNDVVPDKINTNTLYDYFNKTDNKLNLGSEEREPLYDE